MTEIRAFVGHSFNEDDDAVVRRFKEHFDALEKSNLNFSWEHAEDAEPTDLADKVKKIISDKNVFIGICTKKERVIQDAALTPTLFNASVLKAPKAKFSWKTSDWIIQEIGLAIGNDLKLILLVENDVLQPGGLQGNIEYISFDRAAPEKCFDKILAMITALSPKASSPATTSDEARSLPAEGKSETETPSSDDWLTPTPEWSRRNYELAVFHLTLDENPDGIAEISKAYLETEDAQQDDNKKSWPACIEVTRIRWGKGGDLTKLQKMAKNNPENSSILRYLAIGYEKYQEYLKAANCFEAAADKEVETAQMLQLKARAAESYVRAGASESAITILKTMKIEVEESGDGELQLLNALRKISELNKEDVVNLAIMERIVEINPTDKYTRFSLAYKYSECNEKDVSLFHYLKIPFMERNAGTWNNLGVVFDHFELRSKSVDSYRRSKEMGETLAMSNLAGKFIEAGFLTEARKECDEALAIKDSHEKVGYTSARVKSLPEEEEEKQKNLLEKTKPKSDFYKQFGRAVAQSEPREMAESWEGPDGILSCTLSGQSFNAVCLYERPLSGLMALGIGSGDRTESFRAEYIGTLRGRTIEANVTRNREGEKPKGATLLGSSEDKIKALMIIADDESEIKVMENPSGSRPRFYTLMRKTVSE